MRSFDFLLSKTGVEDDSIRPWVVQYAPAWLCNPVSLYARSVVTDKVAPYQSIFNIGFGILSSLN